MKNRNIIFAAILSALVCFPLLLNAQAGKERAPAAPQLALPGFNTADGDHALANTLAGGGNANSGFGWYALFANGAGSYNTGVGAAALALSIGDQNTAVGTAALLSNGIGNYNNAVGVSALQNNGGGFYNNAHGRQALTNSDASENNAFGDFAMQSNTTGSSNTAIGDDALRFNVDGNGNVAVGDEAGTSIVSASNMVAIGAPGAGPYEDTSNTCFIASIYNQPISDAGTGQDVYVDQYNVLGFLPSSQRFKHDIQAMDKASESLYGLEPVTFKYNSDKTGRTQYGLIAEEVAKVAPDLVVRDNNGSINTVRFEQIGSMLLNEFLKEHKKVQALEATVAQQQKGMEVLTAQLKEQAAQIQKVSAQVEMGKPAPQVVANKP
jgi:hypothetical protein